MERPKTSKPTSGRPAITEQVDHASTQESTKRAFEGMHDYRSTMRILGYHFSKGGAKKLLEFIKQEPVESFSTYFKGVARTNQNLKTKIEHDIALHPGVVNELEAIVERLNESETEADVFHAYEDLKKFFGD